MRLFSTGNRKFFIGIVCVIGVVTGAMVLNSPTAKTPINPNFPKNQNGQTYGSASDATSPESEPDLIKAIGLDGTEGYVLKTDFDGKKPRNPIEALEQQRNAPESRTIPLYDVDGKTVIGQFKIGGT